METEKVDQLHIPVQSITENTNIASIIIIITNFYSLRVNCKQFHLRKTFSR